MIFCRGEVDKCDTGTRRSTQDEIIERKIVEGFPDLCTHVRARVERLSAFFELPPDLSLPQAQPVRSIWELPPPPASPPRPRRMASYHQRTSGFR